MGASPAERQGVPTSDIGGSSLSAPTGSLGWPGGSWAQPRPPVNSAHTVPMAAHGGAEGGSLARLEAMTPPENRLDPTTVLRESTFDPTALLVLWCARKTFLPLLWGGVLVALVATQDVASLGDRIEQQLDSLNSPGELLASLVGPFALIILAVGLRLVVEALALGLAYPLTRGTDPTDYTRGSTVTRYSRMWWDRVYLTRSLRALRWSWAVREAAADRLGRRGRVLERCSTLLGWANAVLLAVLVVAIALYD